MELVNVVVRNAQGDVTRSFVMSRIGSIELIMDYERRQRDVIVEVTPLK